MTNNFMIGCNYWDSTHGTDMWRDWNEQDVDADLAALEAVGVKYLRVFPNWRDFQPVCRLYAWRGQHKEYRLTGERFPENEYYIEPVMIERFLTFCDLAEKHGMKLIVSVLTGWMSGRLFTPPLLEGKNLIRDHEALMFEERFVRGFVGYVKHHSAIDWWDLGNECNCLGQADTGADAYVWTVTIRNAILAADRSRKIMSGMHGLTFEPDSPWSIKVQGELTDMLTPHPYPSPTIGGDVEPADRMRTTILPTAQCTYYSDLGGKPAMIQEQGTFSDMLINREGAADFLRVNICSAWANGFKGYLWWCGCEHLCLTQPPYSWSMIERELGILDLDRNPKPVATQMKAMSDLMETLPDLPEKEIDAVCVLSREQQQWQVGAAAYILGKQAGLQVRMASCYDAPYGEIPKAPIYLLPSIMGWAALYKECFDLLLERVHEDGAALYISVGSGFVTEFEKVTGMRSHGMMNAGGSSVKLELSDGGLTLPVQYNKKFLLERLTADVLGHDADGTPVFSRHSFGKGKIYLLGFPLEQMLWNRPMIFAGDDAPAYWRIYREVGRELLAGKVLTCANPQIGLTLHPCEDGSYYAVAVNYSEKEQDTQLTLAEGWKLESVYGGVQVIGKCDMTVYRVRK
ncbi:MAG: hypothetical protein IJ493_01900 [Clostridia bacterium]|nr:hypothetical protein [Clostridia bacterium]